MGKMKSLKCLSLVLFLIAGLFAGCSGDSLPENHTTSVSPSELNSLTEGGTKGSGDVTNDVVTNLLRTANLAGTAQTGAAAIPALIPKTSSNGFGDALKPMDLLYVPGMNKMLTTIFRFATTGSSFDPSGSIGKITGTDKLFSGANFKLSGTDLGTGVPACLYIDGLPSNFESFITGASTTPPTDAELQEFFEDFEVTFGFTGECDLGDDYGNMVGKGAIKLLGNIAVAADGIETAFGIIMKGLEINIPANPGTGAVASSIKGSGSIGFEISTSADATEYEFLFLLSANKMSITSKAAESFVYYLDGALAFMATGSTIATLDFIGGLSLQGEGLDDLMAYLPEYMPDLCNSDYMVVYDMTMKFNDIEIILLWGAFITITSEGVSYCDAMTITKWVWVFFTDSEHWYICAFTSVTSTGFTMTILGSAGQTATVTVDMTANTCTLTKPGESTATADSCTWSDLYEGDLF